MRIQLKNSKNIEGISNDAMEVLMAYDWPGNVRELKSAFEYAFVTCQEPLIQPYHLPANIYERQKSKTTVKKPTLNRKDMKKKQLIDALKQAGGNQSEAARILGVSRVTVWNRMKRFGIHLKRNLDT
jgi:transcriptional regulator of acetoin/glycerol metabolism